MIRLEARVDPLINSLYIQIDFFFLFSPLIQLNQLNKHNKDMHTEFCPEHDPASALVQNHIKLKELVSAGESEVIMRHDQ